ncbi:MAG: PRC-barrel domain containing protein [Burkholderiaceae bacterium]|nr:PRC-barrel domain containing protein [Burkholderiaceae bacterium]
MLRTFRRIQSARINAVDDQVGRVEDVYFDDEAWTIRYLVVDTGNWLPGRKVLISPYSIKTPITAGDLIDVKLTRQQLQDSPPVDTHQPVSRRHEREYLSHFGYPSYWGMGGVWGPLDYPLFPYVGELQEEVRRAEATGARDAERADEGGHADDADSHLRSAAHVTGYDIQASDGSIGHVQDFVFDDESWAIRYMVIDTVNWWPGGRKVLVSTRWIDRIDWAERAVHTSLTREGVKRSPEYDENALLDRQYEKMLHEAHQRAGYWE